LPCRSLLGFVFFKATQREESSKMNSVQQMTSGSKVYDAEALNALARSLPALLGIGIAHFHRRNSASYFGPGSEAAFECVDFSSNEWQTAYEAARTGRVASFDGHGQGSDFGAVLMCANDPARSVIAVISSKTRASNHAVSHIANSVGLTNSETAVLSAICEGLRPTEVAKRRAVSVSTVRSQVQTILEKTQKRGIAELVASVYRFAALGSVSIEW
jgi:DNA-binding CsgD family transcriptional regulator